METIKFLIEKGLIKPDKTQMTISGDFGSVALNDLLTEYRSKSIELGGFTLREFEVSPKTNIDPAVFQMILDYNGVAILFSDEYTDRNSAYAQILRERMTLMIQKLNSEPDFSE